jgi:uncharacterized protein YqgV (UPF0045/DUF77 family)
MNASVAIQVLPKVDGNAETCRVVDAVIDYIKSYNLPTVVGPFETVIEGDYDVLMEVVRGCPKVCVEAGAPGLLGYVKINYNPGGVMTMDEKIGKYQ